MFPKDLSIESLNDFSKGSMVSHIGIEFVSFGNDFLLGKMPVDSRTKQPMGLLHGGASVAFAETLGSVASSLLIDLKTHVPVGIEINANHVKSAKTGYVFGRVSPVHIGKKSHVWDIRITNEQEDLVCISRLTTSIIEKRN